MFKTKIGLRSKLFAGSAALFILFFGSLSFAGALTANTTINSTLSPVISLLTSSGTVTLNVLPTGAGAQTIAGDTVTVSTNDSSGYTLTLANSSANTYLASGANQLPASAGAVGTGNPVVMTANTWGYCLYDASYSTNGWTSGNCPSTGASNAAISGTYKFAGVPATGSPATIDVTSTTAASRAETVYYAVAADTSQATGLYSTTVTYTATTN